MKPPPLPAVTERAAGRGLRLPALAAADAPTSASGSVCGSNSDINSTGGVLGYAEMTAAASVSIANGAASPLLRASSICGNSSSSQQRYDPLLSPVPGGDVAEGADLGKHSAAFPYAPGPAHNPREDAIAATAAQESRTTLPSSIYGVTSLSDSTINGGGGLPLSHAAYLNALHSPFSFYVGPNNPRSGTRAVGSSRGDAVHHIGVPLGAPVSLARASLSSSVRLGASRAAGFAVPSVSHDAPGLGPPSTSVIPIVRGDSAAVADSCAGASPAGYVALPGQRCPVTVPATQRDVSSISQLAGAASVPEGATGAPTESVSGTGGITSIVDDNISSIPLHTDIYTTEKAACVLVRGDTPTSTQSLPLQEGVHVHTQAPGAGTGSLAAISHGTTQSLPCGSRREVGTASSPTPRSASHPAVPSGAAGATDATFYPAALATSSTGAVGGEFADTRGRGTVEASELSVKPSSLDISSYAQASSFAHATTAPRCARHHMQLEREFLTPSSAVGNPVATVGDSSRAASKRAAPRTYMGAASAAPVTSKVRIPVGERPIPNNSSGAQAVGHHVSSSVGEVRRHSMNKAAPGKNLPVARSNCASSAAVAVEKSAAGFLQRTKRIPRETHRPSRRVLPHKMTFYASDLSLLNAAARTAECGFPSVPMNACASAVSPPYVASSARGFSAAPHKGREDCAVLPAAASGSATAFKAQQAHTTTSCCLPAGTADARSAFYTPEHRQRPPWRALTPEQLLLQRASRKRLLTDSTSQPFSSGQYPKVVVPPPWPASGLEESSCIGIFSSCSKQDGIKANAAAAGSTVLAEAAKTVHCTASAAAKLPLDASGAAAVEGTPGELNKEAATCAGRPRSAAPTGIVASPAAHKGELGETAASTAPSAGTSVEDALAVPAEAGSGERSTEAGTCGQSAEACSSGQAPEAFSGGLAPEAGSSGKSAKGEKADSSSRSAEVNGNRQSAKATSRRQSSEADSSLQSAAAGSGNLAGPAAPCKSEARRTRKPSRLSLEAAETYSLTLASRQQRRTTGRNIKDNPTTSLDVSAAAASPANTKRVRKSVDSAGAFVSPGPAAAVDEVQRQTPRQPTTRTKRVQAESSAKQRHPMQRQQRQRQNHHPPQRQNDEEWIRLTSSQQQRAATYSTIIQRQPVFLRSCSFMLCPPGFAGSPAAVRRVCLAGTLQQPVYVPRAASLKSVRHTVERLQQDAAAAVIKFGMQSTASVPTDSHITDASSSSPGSSCALSSSDHSSEKIRRKKVNSSSTVKSDAGSCVSCTATSCEGNEGENVVRFIESATVSGYLYHWYARMHVSAQLEAQLHQLLSARERLAQQLCDGSELHSNLFFFSLFPQDYGVEQFKYNLRFFPQYAVATAAAEAVGLQPLELYGDSSCTATIAEVARRAKWVEQLYEEEQLQQYRHLAEMPARSQEQKHCSKQLAEHHFVKSTALQGAQEHTVGNKQHPPASALESSPAKLRQQGTVSVALASNAKGGGLSSQTSGEVSATGGPTSKKEANTSLLKKGVPRDGSRLKGEDYVNSADGGLSGHEILDTARGHAGKDVASGFGFACAGRDGDATTSSAFHVPALGCSATTTAENGEAEESPPSAVEGARHRHDGNSVLDINAGAAATCLMQRSSYYTEAANSDKQRHSVKRASVYDQSVGDVEKQEGKIQWSQGDVGTANMDERAKIVSQDACRDPAVEPVTARAGAAEVPLPDLDVTGIVAGDTKSKSFCTVLDKSHSQTSAAHAVQSEPNESSQKGRSSTENVNPRPAAHSVNRCDSADNLLLLDDCTIMRREVAPTACDGNIEYTGADTSSSCCIHSAHASDCSSCDSGSSRCADSSSRQNSSTTRCKSDSTGTSARCIQEELKLSQSIFSNGALFNSSSDCCVDGKSRPVAISSTGTEGGSSVGGNTMSTSKKMSGSGCCSDRVHSFDKVSLVRSSEEGGTDGSCASVVAGATSAQTACTVKGSNNKTSGTVSVEPPARTGGAQPLTYEDGSGSSSGNCRSRGSDSDGDPTPEGIAEARYFPIIPRVGTLEIATVWRLIHASEQLLLELDQQQQQEKAPQQLEEQLPLLVKTLPLWWMGGVDLGMQQQLTALTLQRVLPGLAAWQGRDLRLIGNVLPFAARGLLTLSLCQLEHRIATLQQQLAAAVGGLQVLMASLLLLQQVEEHFAPPLYSLPQHVLACLYSRGGGRGVASPVSRERPTEEKKDVHFANIAEVTTSFERMSSNGSRKNLLSAGIHAIGDKGREKGPSGDDRIRTSVPPWEAGIRQGAPITRDGFAAYADAFEDYLPTLGREEACAQSMSGSDTEVVLRTPVAARRERRIGQEKSRARTATGAANKTKNALMPATTKGRRRTFAGKRGVNCRKDSSRKTGSNLRKVTAAKLHGGGRGSR